MASNGRPFDLGDMGVLYYGQSTEGPDKNNFGVHTNDGMRGDSFDATAVDAGFHGREDSTALKLSPYVFVYGAYLGYALPSKDEDGEEFGVNKSDGRRIYFSPNYFDNADQRPRAGEFGIQYLEDGSHQYYVGYSSERFFGFNASYLDSNGDAHYARLQWYTYDDTTGSEYSENPGLAFPTDLGASPGVYSFDVYRENNQITKHAIKIGNDKFYLTTLTGNPEDGYSLVNFDTESASGQYVRGERDYFLDFGVGNNSDGPSILNYYSEGFYIHPVASRELRTEFGYGGDVNREVWGKDAGIYLMVLGYPIYYQNLIQDTEGNQSYSRGVSADLGLGENNWSNFDLLTENDSGRYSYFFVSNAGTREQAHGGLDGSTLDFDIGRENDDTTQAYLIAAGSEYRVNGITSEIDNNTQTDFAAQFREQAGSYVATVEDNFGLDVQEINPDEIGSDYEGQINQILEDQNPDALSPDLEESSERLTQAQSDLEVLVEQVSESDVSLGSDDETSAYLDNQLAYFTEGVLQSQPPEMPQPPASNEPEDLIDFIVALEIWAIELAAYGSSVVQGGLPELSEIVPLVESASEVDPNELYGQLTEGIPVNGIEQYQQQVEGFVESQSEFFESLSAILTENTEYFSAYVDRNSAYAIEYVQSRSDSLGNQNYLMAVDSLMIELQNTPEGSPLHMLSDAYIESV